MKRYIFIGKYKKPLNNNYDDKCSYLKNLRKKRRNEIQNYEKLKNNIIIDKVLNNDENFQRDYSFFSFINPGYKDIKKLPKIKIYPEFKYTFKSPAEKYHSYRNDNNNENEKNLKNSLICFPRAVKSYKRNKSKSLILLPKIK